MSVQKPILQIVGRSATSGILDGVDACCDPAIASLPRTFVPSFGTLGI